MIQEEKDLLLKDLCARLPYGVKISIPELWTSEKKIEVLNEIFKGDDGLYRVNDNGMIIEYITPYLFPLSSMTEEQREEALPLLNNCDYYDIEGTIKWLDKHPIKFFDWCNKNHFDYRGLILMGLAMDATGLNIY